MSRQPKKTPVKISRDKIRRSVASSSAIETGESSKIIEARLKSGQRKFASLTLAW